MDTTGMCLELYYQLKSKATIVVWLIDEETRRHVAALTDHDNGNYWDRMFVKLTAGIHRIRIDGRRSPNYCGMSIDDVVVQPCHRFG